MAHNDTRQDTKQNRIDPPESGPLIYTASRRRYPLFVLWKAKNEVARPEPPRVAPSQDEQDRGTGVLCCPRCWRPVTSHDARIHISGGYEHSFVNPAGIRYRIGCFARAGGCVPVGARSSEFTWFPGYTWQILLCAACGEHLGWLFRGECERFFGLILHRLVEIGDGV
jgi:hypothetical protein